MTQFHARQDAVNLMAHREAAAIASLAPGWEGLLRLPIERCYDAQRVRRGRGAVQEPYHAHTEKDSSENLCGSIRMLCTSEWRAAGHRLDCRQQASCTGAQGFKWEVGKLKCAPALLGPMKGHASA